MRQKKGEGPQNILFLFSLFKIKAILGAEGRNQTNTTHPDSFGGGGEGGRPPYLPEFRTALKYMGSSSKKTPKQKKPKRRSLSLTEL